MTDQADDQTAGKWVPPYVPWATMTGFIERLSKHPLPPRIDKGFLENYSGAIGAQLLAALKAFKLVDQKTGAPTDMLKELVAQPDQRKVIWLQLVEDFYDEQQQLAVQNATSQQLHESFMKYGFTGSTLRKAIVFYLGAVEYSGAKKSPYFKPPRQPATTKTPKAKLRPTVEEEAVDEDEEMEGDQSLGRVDLPSGGVVSLSVSVDLFRLSSSEREFIFRLIDAMKAFQEGSDLEEVVS